MIEEKSVEKGVIIVYHGEGREVGEILGYPPVDRSHNNLFGYGFYVSEDPNIAKIFGENITKYSFNIKLDEIMMIHSDKELNKLHIDAIENTGLIDFDKAIPQYAKSLGYKAIKGTKEWFDAAGINILDTNILKELPEEKSKK